MMQKIYLKATAAAWDRLCGAGGQSHPDVRVATAAPLEDGSYIVIVYPHGSNARFSLDGEDGINVLPGHHDPAAIGPHAKHMTHVKAKPTHTMREAALLLHAAHGPAFHPDT